MCIQAGTLSTLLHNKLLVVLLIQHRRVQHISRARPNEIHLQMISILETHTSIAEVIRIGKHIGRGIPTNARQPFDVTRPTSNDIHRRLGVIQLRGVRDRVVDGQEALRVVHVSEDGEVDAVLVEQGLESVLASCAGRAAFGGVPGAVAADDHPGGHGAVDGGEVCGEPVELLVCGAERAGVQVARGTAWLVRRAGEIGFGIDHGYVNHS